jgi:SAM-dependent methyltransferase
MSKQYYGQTYYKSISRPSRIAAEAILPHLDDAVGPQSVVDVGCGAGAWLEVWTRMLGKTDILGIDGDYVDEDQLFIPKHLFQARDVSAQIDLPRTFDLAMALEVAEHLPPPKSEQFVDNLVRLSDRVLFSAAPPGQGGRHHINERPYDYWKELFERRGYQTFDYVRPHALQFSELEPWFKYNPFLFVRESACARLPEKVLRTRVPTGVPVKDFSPIVWRGRKLILRRVPISVVSALSDLKHKATVMFGGIGYSLDSSDP